MNIGIDRQLEILAARTVNLVSLPELRQKLESAAAKRRPLRVKYGADPSAADIHLGHVVGLNKLREFQDLGHTVVFIIGDFTAMIGDPSGRSETRPPLTREQIAANAQTYQEQVFKVLDKKRTEVRFNAEWCAKLALADVLRLAGQVTVAQLISRDDFQKRLQANQPLAMVELLYPIIQGYDSIQVKADVEVGGTDQLFNLLVGRDLQKAFQQEPQVVLTLPLLEGLDGERKMSKSLGNYVGVSESPREMFGKIMSIPDKLMGRYFALVLGWAPDKVATLERELTAGKQHPRQVKDLLAQTIVKQFHDEAAALNASAEFARVFAGHQAPDEMPTVAIPMAQRPNGKLGIVELLVASGLAASNGAARRLVQQGAVRVGETAVSDITAKLVIPEGCVIQAGKRGFARIVSA